MRTINFEAMATAMGYDKVDDMAIALKVPVGTVRSRIFRAREFIESRMAHLTSR